MVWFYHHKIPDTSSSIGFSSSSFSIGTEFPGISNNTPMFDGGGS